MTVEKFKKPKTLRRQAALLDAAAQVFGGKDHDAATMSEIAARAQCSIGSLYLDYPTKEHVAIALNAQMADTIVTEFHALRASRAWNGRFSAYDARDGRRLWSFASRAPMIAPPPTYRVGTKQYATVLAGMGTAAVVFGP